MRVPDRFTVRLAYTMKECDPGLSVRQIAEAVGVAPATIGRWLGEPQRYHPYIDQVAVARALGGDKAVWDRLTVFEEQAFMRRLAALRAAMTAQEWSEYLEALTGRLAASGEARVRMVKRFGQAVARGST